MSPVYWIPSLALIGAVLGCAFFRSFGWLGTSSGMMIGAVTGATPLPAGGIEGGR